MEKNWKSVLFTSVEDIGKYGLEYWIYFQVLQQLIAVFLVISVFAGLKLAYVMQGSGLQLQDPFAMLARGSFGNVGPDTTLQLGQLLLSLGDKPQGQALALGLLDVLMLLPFPGFLLWLRWRQIPRLALDPELRSVSAADYAVRVDGLPLLLPHSQATQGYDMELVHHFEAVLRDEFKAREARGTTGVNASPVPGGIAASAREAAAAAAAASSGGAGGLVCEAVLARDFDGALLSALGRERAEAAIASLPPGRHTNRAERLKRRAESLGKQVAAARVEESERPTLGRAFVILGSKEERDRLLRVYRFAHLPLVGRFLQPARLRLHGRWSLELHKAPEPTELVWEHMHLDPSLRDRRCRVVFWARRALTALVLVLMLALAFGLSLLVFWALLGLRGAAAAQCSPWALTGYQDPGPCLLPGNSGLASGCECVCVDASAWVSSASTCRTLDALPSSGGILLVALLTEALHWLLAWLIPRTVERWRHMRYADEEQATMMVMALAHCLTPLVASFVLLALKALPVDERLQSLGKLNVGGISASGLSAPLLWAFDRGWYLHGAGQDWAENCMRLASITPITPRKLQVLQFWSFGAWHDGWGHLSLQSRCGVEPVGRDIAWCYGSATHH